MGLTMASSLPFTKVQRDRRRQATYHYFRRNGRQWRLPGQPGSPEFMAEYQRLLAESDKPAPPPEHPVERRDFPRGTFGRLVLDFLASSQWRTKKPSTRAEYRRVCELLSREHGHKRVARMERRHVRRMIDDRSETPGAANTVLRMMKVLLSFAVDDGLIQASPASKIKELPIGEWRAWTDAECSAFEKCWAPGTMQRRAYVLALYTGQRLRDLVAMTRADRDGGWVRVRQSKTGEELWVAEHRELTAELGRGVAGIAALLTTPTQGKPFDPVYLGAWMADAIGKAGLPEDCVLHGLRKTAARTLAELGCSEETIKSITGHVTSRMVARYVKGANQRKLSKAAVRRWENAK
jgi:integrase